MSRVEGAFSVCLVEKAPRRGCAHLLLLVFLVGALSAGCGDQMRTPTLEELAAFEHAAAVEPTVDMDRIEKARLYVGPYRVVPGDVLEFTMPALLQAVTAAEVQAAQNRNRTDAPYICRVSNAGTITLPAVGEIADVAGLSLAEIEERVVEAYAQHVVLRPSVFVQVLEYRMARVYIAGAVENPGVYTLRPDQMTLVSLLTEAGGLAVSKGPGATAAGASIVRILRSERAPQAGPSESTAENDPTATAIAAADLSDPRESQLAAEEQAGPVIVLPVVGMSIPFRDVGLEEGDTIVVEQVQMPLFTVIGLVNRPGNYEYPPTSQYNLMQAIAYAGGLDMGADPRYATIYRLAADGSVVRVPFRLVRGNELTDAMSTPIRPGDVVAIEHTPRTRMNAMINNMVRFNTGLYIQGRDLWGN